MQAVFGISCPVPLPGGGLYRLLSLNRLRDWPRDTRTSCLHSKNVNRPTCYVYPTRSDFIISAILQLYVSCYTGLNVVGKLLCDTETVFLKSGWRTCSKRTFTFTSTIQVVPQPVFPSANVLIKKQTNYCIQNLPVCLCLFVCLNILSDKSVT